MLLFQDIHNSPVDVVNKAISFFEEYKKENAQLEGEAPNCANTYWRAPPHGVYKINTDAAILNQQGIGFGVIIDHAGSIIAAASRF